MHHFFSPISTKRLPSLHARYDKTHQTTTGAAEATCGLESHLPSFLLATLPLCQETRMFLTGTCKLLGTRR